MIRTSFAAATIIAGLFASQSAYACISCEYVPEVVRQHTTERPAASYRQSRAYVSRSGGTKSCDKAEPARKRVKSARVEKPNRVAKADREEPVRVAKAKKEKRAEPVETASVAPRERKVETKAADSESSSITVAAVDAKSKVAQAVDKQAEAKPTDCKKFFPSVGMTLTVPCE